MAPFFIFPPNLSSLELEPEDNRLFARNPTLPSSHLNDLVQGVCFDLSDKEVFCIEEQDVFDRVYSLIKNFSSLPHQAKFNFVESLRSNFIVLLPNIESLLRNSNSVNCGSKGDEEINEDNEDEEEDELMLDRVSSYRNAFKIYTYFLFVIVINAEESSGSGNPAKITGTSRKKQVLKNSWNWESQRGRILNLIANSLEINLGLLFGSSDPDENYLCFITKNTFVLLENATLLKDSEVKDALCRIVGICGTKYHYTAQSCASILYLIYKYDYVITHMADAVARAEMKFADGSLANALIREIGRTNPKDFVKDTGGAENVGRFLVDLADRIPKLVSTNIGVLVPHFAGESYKMRNALVGVLGKLVAKAFKDVEGEISSKSVRLRAKQAMLEILLERCRDVSAYTRSRVLQVWAELCEEHSVHIGLWNEVAEVAAGRLEDKGAIVRKSALNLLIMMLQHNPFGPQLRVASFKATLEEYKKKLNELEASAPSGSGIDAVHSDTDTSNINGEVDDGHSQGMAKDHQQSLTDSCNLEGDDVCDSPVPDVGNLEQTRALVASLEAGLRFSMCVSTAMPTLVQLMASSSATDVENTILLLMRCKQFQIDGSESCLRKMLPLVFSQDKSIYQAVENAFVTIYITKSPLQSAKNLLSLAIDSNIGDLAALESMVGALVSKGDISTAAISALWDIFCFNVSGTTAEQSRGALSILCMAANSSTGILGSHSQDIIDIGFGRWSKVDPLLARTACVALQRLSEEEKTKLMHSTGGRIFGILESLITSFSLPEIIWYAAVDKAICAVYSLHPTPETLAANLVKKSISSVFDSGQNNLNDVIDGSILGSSCIVQVTKLSRCLFVLSHIAMNQLLYIESCVKKIQKQKTRKEKIDAERQNAHSNGTATTDAPKDSGINEIGLAASDDAVLDSLSERAEKEIVSGGSTEKRLIGNCATFLSRLCRNFNLMQKYPDLQASGMLALCRFMIIDADFCNANLQLLFTVVESAPSETVRSNCTVALGDLAVRFPNLLEPWTENMYARLRDPSGPVRKNAVLVLSHLILNDMMKVKGYINEMAMRLEDEDERISSLVKLFFHELSKKGHNPIYNLLPDILGKLSNQNLTRESFCNIMQFLIGSIKKDKQMESLVEKLCNRFSGVVDVKQWEYISYCLSQLAFTEKGLKRLMDSFKTYEHALSEDSVMENFRSIINKSKKFAKPEVKSLIEEFDEKLSKIHKEKKEQEVTARNAQIHQKKVGNLESSLQSSNKAEESADTDLAEGSEIIDETTNGNSKEGMRRSVRRANRSKVPQQEESSSVSSDVTESESDDSEVESPEVNSRGTSKFRKDSTNRDTPASTTSDTESE